MAFTSALSLLLRFYFVRENNARDREQAQELEKPRGFEPEILDDLTDRQNRSVTFHLFLSDILLIMVVGD